MTKMQPIIFSALFFLLSLESEAHKLVPALYIFGDSLNDAGNNNFRLTSAKNDYFPYGIDHPLGTTGRATNGRTVADFFAESLGLHYQPPVLQMEHGLAPKQTFEGLNYASGSSGILDETGSIVGMNLCLRKQIRLFKKTVKQYLPLHFRSQRKLARHLSKSIFFLSLGFNDHGLNFLNMHFNTSHLYNYQQFSDLLIDNLSNHLQTLYRLGARRFVVSEIAPFGCAPFFLEKADLNTGCVDEINSMLRIYNAKLATRIDDLRYNLTSSTFILLKAYNLTYDLISNPNLYGVGNSRKSCCDDLGVGPCVPLQLPCSARNDYVFFDAFHPSEVTNKILATQCFNGTGLCVPINIQQLVKKI